LLQDIFAFILDLLSTQLRPSKSSAASANRAASAHPTKNEFYKQYFYLLESLANCKSVILMLDAEEGGEDGQAAFEGEESLVARTFKEFFDLVRWVIASCTRRHAKGPTGENSIRLANSLVLWPYIVQI
jgi:hypothetical protein